MTAEPLDSLSALPGYVKLVLAPNPGPMTGPGTNSFLVGESGCYIIDPGPEDQEHLETLAREGQARGGVRGILITHGHHDHYEGARTLAQLVSVPILAWSREGVPVADEELTDQQVIDCGVDRLRVIHTSLRSRLFAAGGGACPLRGRPGGRGRHGGDRAARRQRQCLSALAA